VSDDDECVTTKVNDFQLYKHRLTDPHSLAQPNTQLIKLELSSIVKIQEPVSGIVCVPTN